jgi:hypothetical protein
MGALGCEYGCAPLLARVNSRSAWAAISISKNRDRWVAFLSSIPTKSKKDKYDRARLLRQKICDQVLHKVFGEHSLDNAYAEVDLGSHHHGINGTIPPGKHYFQSASELSIGGTMVRLLLIEL